ncbi:3-phosphoshikimate 1-carboxyvinyltransferase, core domain protein [mine drainage metagenome]|uniref:3-phosphoshikimate 1-carboxyvinyltransferase, core domain protein n=1 Tax=mine drainage metagenome TaxID=410659 RepID=T0YLR8_9ZZZZ
MLRAMGADIRIEAPRQQDGEPIADLRVRHVDLRGIEVPLAHVADMIDEFPILFVAAACAAGVTRVHGAAELRVKESDRIAVMASGLRALGIDVRETPDGALIHGGGLRGGAVDSRGDHRCAMSFAVAGLRAEGAVRISDCANVATSFPGFEALARSVGFDLGQASQAQPA